MMQSIHHRRFLTTLLFVPVFVVLYQISSRLTTGIHPLLIPSIWVVFALLIHYCFTQPYIWGQSNRSREHVKSYALIGGISCIAAQYVTATIMKCLSSTPYDMSLNGILGNLLRVVPSILTREVVRTYAIGSFRFSKRRLLWIVLLTAVLFANDLNYTKLLNLTGFKSVFIYAAEFLVPLLAQHILLTTLSFYGGAGVALIYVLMLEASPYLSPFLPNLPWIAKSAIGICFPLGILVLSSDWGHQHSSSASRTGKELNAGFLVGILLSVAFLWFCVGVFPVYPSVVMTGSMEPRIYPGDVVLIEKITTEKRVFALKSGDIINFKRENFSVTHRITEVLLDEAGNVSFITKGDNNDGHDVLPVLPNDINGLVENVLPKVGFPIMMLRGSESIPEGVVDDVDE